MQRIENLAVGFASQFLGLLQRLLGFLRKLVESDHRDLLSIRIPTREKSGWRLVGGGWWFCLTRQPAATKHQPLPLTA
jgi:hypothetical protein